MPEEQIALLLVQIAAQVGTLAVDIQRLDLEGVEGILDLPKVSRELYTTARVLRVFTFERREVSVDQVLERITRPVGTA